VSHSEQTPLAIDLFCGLGGWTEGLLAEGYYVVGFDIERHDYGTGGYPAQLVLQDALTLHGRQFRDAALIVASPPCQEYSYMAMPWSRAKQIEAEYKTGVRDTKKLTALFDACFRIQREAIEAAGHFIPLVVENVRGAQKWVGRSRWNYGSFHLWGDVPALMPMTKSAVKSGRPNRQGVMAWTTGRIEGYYADVNPGSKVPGFRFDGSGKTFQTASVEGTKQAGISGIRKNGKGDRWFQDGAAQSGSKSKARKARKAASAAIAKIPLPLAQHIARYWRPTHSEHTPCARASSPYCAIT
jgi:hypothetical protein